MPTAATSASSHAAVLLGAQVHSVVSKMMMEEAFAGSWDQPTRSVVMHNAQPSRLQTLASELSDRAAGAAAHSSFQGILISSYLVDMPWWI